MKKLLTAMLISALLVGAAAADEADLQIDAGKIYMLDKAEIECGVITNFAKGGIVWWNFGASEGEEVDPIPAPGWYDLTITYARAGTGTASAAIRSVNALGPYNIHADLELPPTSDEPDDWSVFKTVTFRDLFMDAMGNLIVEPDDCGSSERFIDIKALSLATSDGEPTERARKRVLPLLAGVWLADGALIERQGLWARISIDSEGGFETFGADGKMTHKGTLSLSREHEGDDLITCAMTEDGICIGAFGFDRPGMIHFGSGIGLEYRSGFVTDAKKTAAAFDKIKGTWVAEGDAFIAEGLPKKFVFGGDGGFRAFDADGSDVTPLSVNAEGKAIARGVLKLRDCGERMFFHLWNWGSPKRSVDLVLKDDGTIGSISEEIIYKRDVS